MFTASCKSAGDQPCGNVCGRRSNKFKFGRSARRPVTTGAKEKAAPQSDHLIEALQSVTSLDGEGYEDFVRRAVTDLIGRQIKRADMKNNMDLSRSAAPSNASSSTGEGLRALYRDRSNV
jgi:hypothetical protein